MDPRDLKQILDALTVAGVREFSLKTNAYELNIKRGAEDVVVAPVLAAPTAPAPTAPVVVSTPVVAPEIVTVAPAAVAADTSKYVAVKAPIVGTFFAASSPNAANFVQEGDRVEVGQVLCILEAMKLMNEIEAEVAGVVRKVLVKNATPVEYGQDLFLIDPA